MPQPKTRAVNRPDMPWVIPEVIGWLEAFFSLANNWAVVLETGCGGSTVFFAPRANQLISFEHDPAFAARTRKALQRMGPDLFGVDLRLCNYHVNGLGELPPLDLAFIDGRGRVRSCADAWAALKPGGWLILDDSNRERYQPAITMLDAAAETKIVFSSGAIDHTTAWRKKA